MTAADLKPSPLAAVAMSNSSGFSSMIFCARCAHSLYPGGSAAWTMARRCFVWASTDLRYRDDSGNCCSLSSVLEYRKSSVERGEL